MSQQPVHEDVGFVLRRARFAESSLVVTWITQKYGPLKTSARSALRPGTPLCGRVELFHEVRLGWQETRRGEVHLLQEAEVVWAFSPPLPQAHRALAAAAYFSALVEKILPPAEPAPEIYDLLSRGLRHLASAPPTPRALLHFERELTRLLGILDPEADTQSVTAALASYAGKLPPDRESILESHPNLPPST